MTTKDPFDTLEEDVSDVAPVEDDLDFHVVTNDRFVV